MSGFRAVNAIPTAMDVPSGTMGDETTPTTPRPTKFNPPPPTSDGTQDPGDPSARTPTRDSFNGIMGQRPLPTAPFTPPPQQEAKDAPPPASEPPRKTATRESSHKSTKSLDMQDVDMDEDEEDRDVSENESMASDSTRPAKKKKGQRFFCTDFPPCQLSFTRSEHLARHIRKHTGERPFQCHCSRRFSRLDNLRQHAQTVHVNEDIPGDSLAATGTRFQRQIRTDRVRPPASRSRASTLNTAGTHSRGHSRNLSASSIASTQSTVSAISQMGTDDFRRRPAPLAMAAGSETPQRAQLTVDTFNPQLAGGSPGPTFYHEARSPSGYTTPPSATYSSATNSPRFSSALHSPISTAPRPVTYAGPTKTHTRRLSTPSATVNHPFQHGPGSSAYHQSPYATPLSSGAGSAFQSTNGSGYASPNVPVYSGLGDRRGSDAEAEWRRRTWHPSTHTGMRPATSGLSYYQTPDSPNPAKAPSQTAMRLPGIESFDHAPPVPSLPRLGSPMQLDAPSQPSAEMGIQHGIRKLEIANPEGRNDDRRPPQQGDLNQRPPPSHPGQSQGPPQLPSLSRHEPSRAQHYEHYAYAAPAPPASAAISRQPIPQAAHQPLFSQRHSDQPMTSRQSKRHGWVNGPISPTFNTRDPRPTGYAPFAPTTATRETAQQPVIQTHQGMPTTSFFHAMDDSESSDEVPTPSSSNVGEWRPTSGRGEGYIDARPLPSSKIASEDKASQRFQQRSELPGWSLQNAQMEARKNAREEHQRDSGVELGHAPPQPPVDSGMRRLEALVAVATGEGRA